MSLPRPGFDYCPRCLAEGAEKCRCTTLADWLRWQQDGHGQETPDLTPETLSCPQCGTVTSDGELCGDCLSEQASYFIPDEGGQG